MGRKTLGKREREAGKRHRRALAWFSGMGAELAPLKLGANHFRRYIRRRRQAVVEPEKTGNE